jgi:hypothetical protein
MRRVIDLDTQSTHAGFVRNDALISLVENYISNKENESYYKDLASKDNAEIKDTMHKLGLTECTTDSGTVTITEQKKETFIEEALIELLKSSGCSDGIIKTKEYVDFDALESAIYHETIPGDVIKSMSSCKDVKITTVLRIKKGR